MAKTELSSLNVSLTGKPREAGILPWLNWRQECLRIPWLHINMETVWDTSWSTAIPPGRLRGMQALPFAGGAGSVFRAQLFQVWLFQTQ